MGSALGNGIGGPGVERRRLRLRRRGGSEHLRRTAGNTEYGIFQRRICGTGPPPEDEEHSSNDVSSVVRVSQKKPQHGTGRRDCKPHQAGWYQAAAEGGGVVKVGIVELHPCLVGIVGINIDVIDPLGVKIWTIYDGGGGDGTGISVTLSAVASDLESVAIL
ncbi:Hypothetical predicted protein [Olea europaea subsp. europaea]|uniref:Uncharacterized protein n=1 Tax=Olea europaea subsp. europaea TaxID=158383 RepID=A0A8S0STT5_OLEEU|nr:Hypothetical predicted protein [Olea europaea subsp. europaea]